MKDDDGPTSNEQWQWDRGSSRTGSFTDIKGQNTGSYTPGSDDTGKYLRVTVTYTDPQGEGKSASVVSRDRTLWKPTGAPQFLGPDGMPDTTTTRSVKENAAAGTNVGAPVSATDIRNDRGERDRLTYTLTGTGNDKGQDYAGLRRDYQGYQKLCNPERVLSHGHGDRRVQQCNTHNRYH